MFDSTLSRWHTGTVEIAYADSGRPGDADSPRGADSPRDAGNPGGAGGTAHAGGTGPTVLLLHGGGFADWFTPLAAAPALHRHRVIRAVRAGYTGAPGPAGLTVADYAAHAAALLEHLDAGPAHVFGHSSGATVALQLALDHPHLVDALSLSEPPLIDQLAAPADRDLLRASIGPVIGAALAATARGDLTTAFDTFMTAICGPDFRRVMTDALGPGAVEYAEAHCRSYFHDEIPAVAAWTLDRAAAARLRVPVQLIRGGDSPPPVHRLVSHLADLFPTATVATISGADHLLPLTKPTELGALLATGPGARPGTRKAVSVGR